MDERNLRRFGWTEGTTIRVGVKEYVVRKDGSWKRVGKTK